MLNTNRLSGALAIKPVEVVILILIVGLTAGLLTTQYYLLSVLPAFAILGLLLLVKYPEVCFYIMIFMVPFDALTGGTGFMHFLSISKFFGIALIAYMLFHIFVQRDMSVNVRSNLWVWLILFFAANIFSALMSGYPLVAFESIRQHITLLLVFILTIVFLSEKGFFKTLPIIIIISTSINAVLSIIGYLYHISFLTIGLGGALDEGVRATGLTIDPNFFSSMLIFNLPLIVYWIFSTKKPVVKLFAVVLLLVNIAAIILSFSRAAAIVTLFVALLITIQYIHKFRMKHVIFVGPMIIAAVIIFATLVPASYWEHQKSLRDITDTSIGRRVSYTYVAWDIFKEHPVIGVGPGVFKEYFAQSIYALQFADKNTVSLRRYVHNTYLEVLTGTGLVGLLFFLIVQVISLRNLNSAVKLFKRINMNEHASLVRAYQTSYLSIMAYFFFVSNVYHKYFWLPVALSEIALRFSRQALKSKKDADSAAV